MLSGKNILIGITGGIAAYKTAHLVREFIKVGASVKCILTPSAKNFITPLTLSTLSKNEVFSEFTTDEDNPRWNDHVQLGLWADLFIIAPTTANTLGKMCQGICDNLLMAVYLSLLNVKFILLLQWTLICLSIHQPLKILRNLKNSEIL